MLIFIVIIGSMMAIQSFAIIGLAICQRAAQARLPGTEYSSPEKFRLEVIFYLKIIALVISNIFLAVIAGTSTITTLQSMRPL
ncbi:MAG: hypothetical protein WBA76_05630 [Phormidesmis sp.]